MGFTQPMWLTRAVALVATPFLIASSLVLATGVEGASADPVTVSSAALPTVQVNGVVWTQIVVGNTVYAGGQFTQAQPAGAAVGVSITPVSNLIAYNVTTGELIPSFNPVVNAQVRGLAVSPDGSRIYVAGDFTAVNGQARNRIAALDPATGAPVAGFSPSLNGAAYTVAATATTVFVGGVFTQANSATRSRAAAFAAAGGATLPFAPAVGDNAVRALVVSPDQSEVVLGGSFSSVNGSTNPGRGMAAVNSVTGASLPWAGDSVVRDGDANSAIYSLSADANDVYATGYSYQTYLGNFEGTISMAWNGGGVHWIEDCHGDTYSSAPFNGAVYTASHAHFCGNIGGFQQTDPLTYHRALAFSTQATGVVAHNTIQTPGFYADFGGQPAPTLLNWYPTINAGTYTGLDQGAWSVAAGGSYVVYGGEFTQVNGVRQTGLVRFLGTPEAPTTAVPVATATPTPTATPSTTATPTTTPTTKPNRVATPSVKALGTTTVAAKWKASKAIAGNPVTSYRINVRLAGKLVKHVSVSATKRLSVIAGLKKHKKYSITVFAKDAAGYSATSAAAAVTTHATGTTVSATKTPSKIGKPSVTAASPTAITVKWTTAKASGATPVSSYQVQVFQGKKLVKTIWQPSNHRTVKVSGLKKHTAYRVQVRAANWAGYSALSTVSGATTRR